MAAGIMRDKGVFEFLSSANMISRKYNDITFNLAGAFVDSMSKHVIVEFNSFLSPENIQYLGWVDNIIPYLNEASVYVLPSYYEGCSFLFWRQWLLAEQF